MARAAVQRELPPRLELLCLKALWTLGEGNVNDVRRVVSETKPLAYTTVMTLLDRLARRGITVRRKVGRAFVYAPQLSQDSVRKLAFRDFVDYYFDGSADALREFLRQAPPSEPSVTLSRPPDDGRLDTALL
ncbi:MAG: transcriptional repressor, CopY family [Bryobacterales bacterium]|nr:transcriptional repressor, CopY family [Bryobacterales bacterium]